MPEQTQSLIANIFTDRNITSQGAVQDELWPSNPADVTLDKIDSRIICVQELTVGGSGYM
jgi:hypothetical protein